MSTAASDTVSYEIDAEIGLICLNNPPVNACGASLRQGIAAALGALVDDQAVKAIAVYGAGRCFIAGADITEFGKPVVEPSMPDVCLMLEGCAKPVVAAVHGACCMWKAERKN